MRTRFRIEGDHPMIPSLKMDVDRLADVVSHWPVYNIRVNLSPKTRVLLGSRMSELFVSFYLNVTESEILVANGAMPRTLIVVSPPDNHDVYTAIVRTVEEVCTRRSRWFPF